MGYIDCKELSQARKGWNGFILSSMFEDTKTLRGTDLRFVFLGILNVFIDFKE